MGVIVQIPETQGGRTTTHRVGPFAGLCAVIFWGSALAFIISTIAFSTTYWLKYKDVHVGLWRFCWPICENIKSTKGWFKVVQAFVTLSCIASFASLVLGTIYTLVHSINKSIILQLIVVISALAAVYMVTGAVCFIANVKRHFAVSFYLGWAGAALHIIVVVVAYLQKKQSEA